ncbi:hypothetical protein FACS1894211_13480 [Clostridia bacterium]|nr:hypothetical protein FACS1894211_13480 [Clostridia bacterium]
MNNKIECIRKAKFPFKLWDLSVYAALIVAVVFLIVSLRSPKGGTLEIAYYDKQNMRQVREYDLNKDAEFDLFALSDIYGEGRLTVVVRGGEAWVEESGCHNQICVRMGRIGRVGQQIVCSPYRVVLRVTGAGDISEVII